MDGQVGTSVSHRRHRRRRRPSPHPSPPNKTHTPGPSVLVVGNEGNGLSDAVRAELRAGGVTGGRIPLAGMCFDLYDCMRGRVCPDLLPASHSRPFNQNMKYGRRRD